MEGSVRTSELAGGTRIVTEAVPGAASVSLGFWIDAGSALETPAEAGVSHFLEHLLFKGTRRRSARRIAEEIEGLGGSINAFTGKEHTCFHTRTLAEHLDVAVDVLADLVTAAALRDEDVVLERDVVVQEILEIEDTPEDYVHDFHLERYWPDGPLGRPVAGTVASVEGLEPASVRSYRDARYRSDRLLVAAAGRIDHDRLVALVDRALAPLERARAPREPLAAPAPHGGVFAAERDLEQVHVVVGAPGVAAADPRLETLDLLVTALGGGMSSRLFQTVREERGLAYSVHAFQSAFAPAGYVGVYAAVPRNSLAETCELVLAELAAVARAGLAADELERTRTQLVGSIPLAMESTENRMLRIARDLLYMDRPVPLAETIALLEAATTASVRELAAELLAPKALSIALLGPADASMVPAPRDAA